MTDRAKLLEVLRECRQFMATNTLTLDCIPGESDRECYNRCRAALVSRIDALLSHPEEAATAKGLPVAWRYRYRAGGTWVWKYVDTEAECNSSEAYEREPLYTSRQAAQSGQEGGE